MSRLYQCRPSEIINIDDEYTAFCFDEACAFIAMKLLNGEHAKYIEQRVEVKEYKTGKDFYRQFGYE